MLLPTSTIGTRQDIYPQISSLVLIDNHSLTLSVVRRPALSSFGLPANLAFWIHLVITGLSCVVPSLHASSTKRKEEKKGKSAMSSEIAKVTRPSGPASITTRAPIENY